MKPSRCLVLTAAPHGVDAGHCDAAVDEANNKDIKHSITALGVGFCKAIPILPNVNKQSSLCIRSLPNRWLKYVFSNDYFNQDIANVQRTCVWVKQIRHL